MQSEVVDILLANGVDARSIITPKFKNARASYQVQKMNFDSMYQFSKYIASIIGGDRLHFYQLTGKTYEFIIEPRSAIIESSEGLNNSVGGGHIPAERTYNPFRF